MASPPLHNQLLSMLPDADHDRLAPHLEPIELSQGEVIYGAQEPVCAVIFPIDCLISLVSAVDHSATEFGLVGNEGLVGIWTFLGGSSSISKAVVQVGGHALKLEAAYLKAEFDRCGHLYKILLLYVQWLLTQTIQNGACLIHHSTDFRLARWILSVQDRLQQDDLHLTQKYIAELLGTRRATITHAAGRLQELDLIRYSRGVITIIDRRGLEEHACECYARLQQEQERLHAISSIVD